MYSYKTNLKTLKKVYALLEEAGLFGIFGDQQLEINMKDVFKTLITTDLTNEFCQLVTGEKIDFDELPFEEQEAVIIGFFVAGKGLIEKSAILQGVISISQTAMETLSTTSATTSGNVE